MDPKRLQLLRTLLSNAEKSWAAQPSEDDLGVFILNNITREAGEMLQRLPDLTAELLAERDALAAELQALKELQEGDH
jgi:hypothetical protein